MARKPETKQKKSLGQWAMLALLGLLAFSLIGFGAANFGGTVQSVASVDGIDITPRQYAAAVQARLRQIGDQNGQQVSFAQAQQAGVDRAVLSQLIGQSAIAAEGRRMGLSIPDSRVALRVRDVPAFQGGSGFSPQVYRETLKRNDMTPTAFERTIRDEEVATLIQQAVTRKASGADWAALVAGWAGERRDLTWADIPETLLPEPVAAPTDQELADWYADNGEAFRRPAEKVMTIWALRPRDLAAELAPSEDDLRAAYDARADEFRIPARRMVERLVFRTEAEADAARERLDDGLTFEDLVAERGLSPADADLGEVSEADLGEAGPAVFALDGPGIAGPAPTPLGPALFQVSAILNPQETPFEIARPRLARSLGLEAARRDIDARYGEFDDELAGGATLEDLAKIGGQIRQITYAEGDAAADTDPALLEAANAAQPGDFPELIQLQNGGLVALRVDEAREARVPDLDEVRAAATQALTAQQRTDALRALAADLASRIGGDETFEDVGLAPRTAEGIARGGPVESAPAGLSEAAFGAPEGTVGVRAADGRVAVFRVDAVQAADEGDPRLAMMRTALEAQAAQSVARDTLDAYVRALVDRSQVRINQTAVTAVNARIP